MSSLCLVNEVEDYKGIAEEVFRLLVKRILDASIISQIICDFVLNYCRGRYDPIAEHLEYYSNSYAFKCSYRYLYDDYLIVIHIQ